MCCQNSYRAGFPYAGPWPFPSCSSSLIFTHASKRRPLPLPPIKTFIMLRNGQFTCLLYSVCVTSTEQKITKQKRVDVLLCFVLYFSLTGSASIFPCRLIKCLMDRFIKTWMVTLFGMTYSVFYIMRSVKHPERNV